MSENVLTLKEDKGKRLRAWKFFENSVTNLMRAGGSAISDRMNATGIESRLEVVLKRILENMKDLSRKDLHEVRASPVRCLHPKNASGKLLFQLLVCQDSSIFGTVHVSVGHTSLCRLLWIEESRFVLVYIVPCPFAIPPLLSF